MNAPRLEIDLDKIRENARTLVDQLAERGISVTGVTKVTLGSPEIASALICAGVETLGDSRIENIETMQSAGIRAEMILLRSPMLSQVARVVAHADASFNTEFDVIKALSTEAQRSGRTHRIVLMVELGDLREGILPRDVAAMVRQTLALPNIDLEGIGTNLACRCGVTPSIKNMSELSAIADSLEATFGLKLRLVSGGNSANLDWALCDAAHSGSGRINNLRLGESILLGREPLLRKPISGLHIDAMTLVAEVIESKIKPSQPTGELAQTAFGDGPPPIDRGHIGQAILAIGRQDTDPDGLEPPRGIEILGASSDHLIAETGMRLLRVGSEVAFQVNYSALVRAMTSPFVAKTTQTLDINGPACHGGLAQNGQH